MSFCIAVRGGRFFDVGRKMKTFSGIREAGGAVISFRSFGASGASTIEARYESRAFASEFNRQLEKWFWNVEIGAHASALHQQYWRANRLLLLCLHRSLSCESQLH